MTLGQLADHRAVVRRRMAAAALALLLVAAGVVLVTITRGDKSEKAVVWTLPRSGVFTINQSPEPVSIGRRLAGALASDPEFRALQPLQRESLLERAPEMIHAYLQREPDDFFDLMTRWGGVLTTEEATEEEVRARWSAAPVGFPWVAWSVDRAAIDPVQLAPDGGVMMGPNPAKGPTAVALSLFRFPQEPGERMRAGAPAIQLRAWARSENGTAHRITFLFVWIEPEQAWLPLWLLVNANENEGVPGTLVF
jgi:hypothetical protein